MQFDSANPLAEHLRTSTAYELQMQDEINALKKQLSSRDNEFKKDKAVLEQTVELLRMQITESKQREESLKKMNDTIMNSLNDLSNQGNQTKIFKEIQSNYEQQNLQLLDQRAKLQTTIANLEAENRSLKDECNGFKLQMKDLQMAIEKERVSRERVLEVGLLDKTQMQNDMHKHTLQNEDTLQQAKFALETKLQELNFQKEQALLDQREKYEEKIRQLTNTYDKERVSFEGRIQKNLNTIKKYQAHIEQNGGTINASFLSNQSRLDTSTFKSEPDTELRSEITRISNEKAKLQAETLKLQLQAAEMKATIQDLKRRLQQYEGAFNNYTSTYQDNNQTTAEDTSIVQTMVPPMQQSSQNGGQTTNSLPSAGPTAASTNDTLKQTNLNKDNMNFNQNNQIASEQFNQQEQQLMQQAQQQQQQQQQMLLQQQQQQQQQQSQFVQQQYFQESIQNPKQQLQDSQMLQNYQYQQTQQQQQQQQQQYAHQQAQMIQQQQQQQQQQQALSDRNKGSLYRQLEQQFIEADTQDQQYSQRKQQQQEPIYQQENGNTQEEEEEDAADHYENQENLVSGMQLQHGYTQQCQPNRQPFMHSQENTAPALHAIQSQSHLSPKVAPFQVQSETKQYQQYSAQRQQNNINNSRCISAAEQLQQQPTERVLSNITNIHVQNTHHIKNSSNNYKTLLLCQHCGQCFIPNELVDHMANCTLLEEQQQQQQQLIFQKQKQQQLLIQQQQQQQQLYELEQQQLQQQQQQLYEQEQQQQQQQQQNEQFIQMQLLLQQQQQQNGNFNECSNFYSAMRELYYEKQMIEEKLSELECQFQSAGKVPCAAAQERDRLREQLDEIMLELGRTKMTQAIQTEEQQACTLTLKNEIKLLINKLLKAKGKLAENQSDQNISSNSHNNSMYIPKQNNNNSSSNSKNGNFGNEGIQNNPHRRDYSSFSIKGCVDFSSHSTSANQNPLNSSNISSSPMQEHPMIQSQISLKNSRLLLNNQTLKETQLFKRQQQQSLHNTPSGANLHRNY